MTTTYPSPTTRITSNMRNPTVVRFLLYGVRCKMTGYLPGAAGRNTSARKIVLSRIGVGTFFSMTIVGSPIAPPYPHSRINPLLVFCWDFHFFHCFARAGGDAGRVVSLSRALFGKTR